MHRPPCPYRGSPGGVTGPGPVNGIMVALGRQRGTMWHSSEFWGWRARGHLAPVTAEIL